MLSLNLFTRVIFSSLLKLNEKWFNETKVSFKDLRDLEFFDEVLETPESML